MKGSVSNSDQWVGSTLLTPEIYLSKSHQTKSHGPPKQWCSRLIEGKGIQLCNKILPSLLITMGRWNVFPNTHQSVVWWRLSWCWCCDIGVCFKTSIIIEATWRTDGCATSPMMVPKDVFNTKTTFPKNNFTFSYCCYFHLLAK